MNEDERRLCRALGISEETYLAGKEDGATATCANSQDGTLAAPRVCELLGISAETFQLGA